MKVERLIETWGTVIVLQIESATLSDSALQAAATTVEEFFYQVDRDFSTYKSESQISKLRRQEIDIRSALITSNKYGNSVIMHAS